MIVSSGPSGAAMRTSRSKRHVSGSFRTMPTVPVPAAKASIPDYPKTEGGVCVSTVSIVCTICLFSDPSKAVLIARRSITTDSPDDADGTDGIFGTRAHPDHSRSRAAFT
jgi:hypothetical protein